MSVFTPTTRYELALPEYPPGTIIKIQDAYYMVITRRHNRKTVALTYPTSPTSKFPFALDSGQSYEDMHGNLKKNRIVHLHYVAIDQTQTTEFFWGTEPLQSKDVDENITPTMASLSNPLAIDRWSYDQAMRLTVTEGGTQNYYFKILEYEVVAYQGQPPRPYVQILQNGQAIVVQEPGQEATIAAMQG